MITMQTGVKHSISLYVSNKPGVLMRIAMVFSRRGFNIESLVVSGAHDPAFSHMNIVATGDERTLDQILKQLNKLVDVVHARDNTGRNVIEREMVLVKVRCDAETRKDVLQVAHVFGCEIMHMDEETAILQVSGQSEKLDAFDRMLDQYGVVEIIRSGKMIISRGPEPTS
jgi:acetolactate synthase-1/3 small subunit